MSAIDDRYVFLKTHVVDLGAPLGEEEPLPDGGAMRRYEHGHIYFHPRVGTAFECYGLILQTYVELGEGQGQLGYPTTGEIDSPTRVGGRVNLFENGRIEWGEAAGVTVVPGHGEKLVLRSGDRGAEVAILQRALARLELHPGTVDGIFGNQTRSAVMSLQTSAGLAVDGIAGERVWVELRDRGALDPRAPDIPYAPGVVCLELARDAAVVLETAGGAVQAASETHDVSALNVILAALSDLEVGPLSGVSPEAGAALDGLVDASGEDIPRLADTYKLSFSPEIDPATLAEQLAELPFVASAAPAYFGRTAAQGDGFLGTSDQVDKSMPGGQFNQWYVYRCGVDRAWNLSTGTGTVIAVIDSGFLLDPSNASRRHEDIFDHVEMAHAAHLRTGGNDVTRSSDVDHGTSTMGIAGALAGPVGARGIRGFAPDAALWPLAVQGPTDTGPDFVAVGDAINRVVAAADPRRLVISISLGHVGGHLEAFPYVESAIRRALAAGITVCIAAGNEGNAIDLHSSGIPVPNTGCIVVGGTGPAAGNPRWNSALGGASNHGARVDVCAPAEQLVAPTGKAGQYTTFRGTSGATPMVAGTAALMLSINPALTPADVRAILRGPTPGAGTTSSEPIGTFLDANAATRAAFDRLVATFGEPGWRWCSKCQILFFARQGASPVCPAGGVHDATSSGDYVMLAGVTTWWSQDQWRWCKRCGGLFYAGAFSACPHGGPHDGSAGGHYAVPLYAPAGVGQRPWLWCKGCGGAVFSAGSASPCYGGTAHDTGASGQYSVILR